METAVNVATTATIPDLKSYTREVAERAQQAARGLALASGGQKDDWLRRSAELIRARGDEILAANEQDIAQAPEYGLNAAAVDRLRLTPERLEGIATALEEVVALPNPVGEVIDSNIRPNGLEVLKVRVPLGVVFFIYESRPNVTVDAAALCVKSGNAVILRGGKEAFHSNQAFYAILQEALSDVGLPEQAVQLVETTDRDAVGHFLRQSDKISVTIPRGGKALIERVAAEATMPVIKHYDGNCHVYVDTAADLDAALRIVINSKCHRPGVCNAAESLLVHREVAETFLPKMAAKFAEQGVEMRCCERSLPLMPGAVPATREDFADEFLDLIISIKVVDDLQAAIDHIEEFSSRHTEAIVTNDLAASRRFCAAVDSAAVIVNASTRFNDGGQFGLGAEIGISTDKFHARGPCGLRELTSYKYLVQGAGQIRE
ncbi:Gamma-glutamyl phosphate reductase [Symmachiella dynata]|uniref:Gamma-glutamyl phosphate reductase n=1 Tax=Symmachiella dynata TaxID=2527995 RepID=A0A517ZUH7_9PLAN|nr:Gamma-glutamyl phosphate reductase [Symmachiella dynata]